MSDVFFDRAYLVSTNSVYVSHPHSHPLGNQSFSNYSSLMLSQDPLSPLEYHFLLFSPSGLARGWKVKKPDSTFFLFVEKHTHTQNYKVIRSQCTSGIYFKIPFEPKKAVFDSAQEMGKEDIMEMVGISSK